MKGGILMDNKSCNEEIKEIYDTSPMFALNYCLTVARNYLQTIAKLYEEDERIEKIYFANEYMDIKKMLGEYPPDNTYIKSCKKKEGENMDFLTAKEARKLSEYSAELKLELRIICDEIRKTASYGSVYLPVPKLSEKAISVLEENGYQVDYDAYDDMYTIRW